MFGFQGKNVLIVNCLPGIARALGRAFAEEKAKVFMLYPGQDECCGKEILAAQEGKGLEISLLERPLSSLALFQEAISEIKGDCKNIDILINYVPTPKVNIKTAGEKKPVAELPFETDFSLFHNCLKIVAPLMLKQGRGRIVNVAGIAIREYVHYMAVRNEVAAVTKTLGRELARKNIYLNAVILGLLEGEDYSQAMPRYLEILSLSLPAQRPAKPEEVTGPILFLASDKASYLFGESLKVDGGLSA